MTKKKSHSVQAGDLRRRAEDKVGKVGTKTSQASDNTNGPSPEEAQRLIHELQIYQVELEMQNDELRRTKLELEDSRARYFDLYDLAPIGYVTLSEKGIILEANLTAVSLLGKERTMLDKHPLTRFIHPDDQNVYYQHQRQLRESGAPQACEVRIVKEDSSLLWVRLEATAAKDADDTVFYRTVISDITGRKQAEIALNDARSKIKILGGMLPICMHCKKIRDDRGYWEQLEAYVSDHSQAEFSHGICPACLKKLYPEYCDKIFPNGQEGNNSK